MVVCYLETYLFVTPHPNVMDGRNRLEKELLALQEKLSIHREATFALLQVKW